jgi:hypothetical protein
VRPAYHDLAENNGKDDAHRKSKIGVEMQDILGKGHNKHPTQGNDASYDVSEREIKLSHMIGHPFSML